MTNTDKLSEKHQKELDELMQKQEEELNSMFSEDEELTNEEITEPKPKPKEPEAPKTPPGKPASGEKPEELLKKPSHKIFGEHLEEQSPQGKPVVAPEGKTIPDLEAELAEAEKDLAYMAKQDPNNPILRIYEDSVKKIEKQIHSVKGTYRTGARGHFADYLDSREGK